MRIYMQKASIENNSFRFCHISLQQDLFGGWTVIVEMGVQGHSGRISQKSYDLREQAEKSIIVDRDKRIEQGYKVVFVEGAYNTDDD